MPDARAKRPFPFDGTGLRGGPYTPYGPHFLPGGSGPILRSSSSGR